MMPDKPHTDVTDDCKLVPIEPTLEMLKAGMRLIIEEQRRSYDEGEGLIDMKLAADIYRAMVSAA